MLDYVGPTLRFPKFLRTRRARMKNDVRLVDLRVTPKRVRFFTGFLRQFQTQRAGNTEEAESLQKQLTIEVRRLQEDAEIKKEKLRASFSK